MQALLYDSIEQPILWAGEKLKADSTGEFVAEVLQGLLLWGDSTDKAKELLAGSPRLKRFSYPQERPKQSVRQGFMAKLREADASDGEVLALLAQCCKESVQKWREHADEYLEGDKAKVMTPEESKNAALVEANNDTSERQIGLIRYIQTGMGKYSLGAVATEAHVVLRLNKPVSVQELRKLGDDDEKTFRLARKMEAQRKKETAAEQRLENQRLKGVYAPKASERASATKGAKTKAVNEAKSTEYANQLEEHLLKSDVYIAAASTKLADLNVMMQGWKKVGAIQFGPGHVFQMGVEWKRSPPKGTGARGALRLAEKRQHLKAICKVYRTMKRDAMAAAAP